MTDIYSDEYLAELEREAREHDRKATFKYPNGETTVEGDYVCTFIGER